MEFTMALSLLLDDFLLEEMDLTAVDVSLLSILHWAESIFLMKQNLSMLQLLFYPSFAPFTHYSLANGVCSASPQIIIGYDQGAETYPAISWLIV